MIDLANKKKEKIESKYWNIKHRTLHLSEETAKEKNTSVQFSFYEVRYTKLSAVWESSWEKRNINTSNDYFCIR